MENELIPNGQNDAQSDNEVKNEFIVNSSEICF